MLLNTYVLLQIIQELCNGRFVSDLLSLMAPLPRKCKQQFFTSFCHRLKNLKCSASLLNPCDVVAELLVDLTQRCEHAANLTQGIDSGRRRSGQLTSDDAPRRSELSKLIVMSQMWCWRIIYLRAQRQQHNGCDDQFHDVCVWKCVQWMPQPSRECFYTQLMMFVDNKKNPHTIIRNTHMHPHCNILCDDKVNINCIKSLSTLTR